MEQRGTHLMKRRDGASGTNQFPTANRSVRVARQLDSRPTDSTPVVCYEIGKSFHNGAYSHTALRMSPIIHHFYRFQSTFYLYFDKVYCSLDGWIILTFSLFPRSSPNQRGMSAMKTTRRANVWKRTKKSSDSLSNGSIHILRKYANTIGAADKMWLLL